MLATQTTNTLAPDIKQGSETLSNIAFERLRSEVVSGNLAPGERLHVEKLGHRYGIGLSPLREALSRLSETGLIVAELQKGFKVAPMSIVEFRDVIDSRLVVEKEALLRSIRHGDVDWEARVVAAYHRLSRVHDQIDSGKLRVLADWTRLNREFHTSVISACDSKWLLRFCIMLYDQTGRYQGRIRKTGSLPVDQSAREHKSLLEAVLARKGKLASTILESHVRSAAERVERGEPTLRG